MNHSVPQLPLALRYPPEQRFDTYLQAPVGLQEHLRALAETQQGDAIFLHGETGAGKTHLLVAACATAGALGHMPAYLGLKHLRGRLATACEGLDNAALVVVDDVDAIAVLQLGANRHFHAINQSTCGVVADIGVNAVGKIEHRRVARQAEDF